MPSGSGGGSAPGGGGQIEWSEGLSRCWKRFVVEATSAQDLMEALVLLEASVIFGNRIFESINTQHKR
jgi:hypothetical protein